VPKLAWKEADDHLAALDPRWERLVAAQGPCVVETERDRFRSLAEAILYQQLAGAAAASIVRKVRAHYGGKFPNAAQLVAEPAGGLRPCGVSPQKERYLRALAEAVEQGKLDFRSLAKAGDEDVIAALTEVPGIGRWTAEMFLIFSLGRQDVLPVGDYGVRQGMRRFHGMKALPKPRTMHRLAKPWAPYRSAGSWYMWKALSNGTEPGIR